MEFGLNILLIIFIAIILDVIFGEIPSKLHPVVWMGKLIDLLSSYLIQYKTKISGVILTFVVSFTFTLATYVLISLLVANNTFYILVSAIILSTTFAIRALIKSAANIKKDLSCDINIARKNMSYLVSRDTTTLSEEDIVSATIETLTENITDSVIGPLFYALIFTVPGAIFYRVINTLDAMVGYKKPETMEIGWFPAKIDDILNYLPARITGIIIVLASFILGMNWRNSYKIMRRDARNPESPNSGFPMAAAAGALGIRLEKIGHYQIGDNNEKLGTEKISKAILLTITSIILFLIFEFSIYIIFLVLLGILII